MTVIKITQFGGIAPSVDPRNLPVEGAQTALNLDLRYGDFRPTKAVGESVATVTINAKTIFRTPSGVWLSDTNDVNYVNGQINDAESERVYLTGRADYPEAWQAGEYRQLGAPAPTEAPSVVTTVTDEFSSTDATTAKEQATAAVLDVLEARETDALFGNAPPEGVGSSPAAPDPLYSSVQLHLQFDELVSGAFVDSSPQKKVITKDASVTFATGAGGPLGAAGDGYATFAGGTAAGIYFSSINSPVRETKFTVDMFVTSTSAMKYLYIEANDGLIRKVGAISDAGARQTLWAENGYSLNKWYMVLKCARADGSAVFPAGTPVMISIQNNGSFDQAFVDGVYVGRTANTEGLRLSMIGYASNTTSEPWDGKMDEFRVTVGLARYDTADPPAAFTPPIVPFSTAAFPPGFWVEHGDVLATGLPTASAGDAAYLVPVSLSGGTYTTTNPDDAYLMQGALGGSQVTYDASQYWAVPVATYQATGKAVDEALLAADLVLVDNPASPGTPLLTSEQADALAAELVALYDELQAPLLTYVTDLNTRQAELQGVLSDGASGTDAAAAAIGKGKIALLQSTASTIESWFSGMRARADAVLDASTTDLFSSIASLVVTRLIETRCYVVTYITDWGEESAPSPPSELFDLDQNDSVSIYAPVPPADRFIVGWRLYRSSTSNTGAAFQLVEDKTVADVLLDTDNTFNAFPTSNLAYADSKLQAELQEVCQTLTWAEPPADLVGLVGLPNGIMAGFYGKTLCLSEPFAPYAWPVEYQQSLEYDIVGLGVFGQTLVALTEGHPYYASGADSASYSAQKMESPQACIAKRTIASVEGGVMYASPDGLCFATANGVELFTVAAFNKEDWQNAVGENPFAAFSEGVYYLFTG